MSARRDTGSFPRRKASGRGVFAIVLTLLIPPLGLMFLWRNGVYRTRGRMLLTFLATVEMAVILVLLRPRAAVRPVAPAVVPAELYTPAPPSDVKTALSNMNDLLQLEQSESDGGGQQVIRISQEEQQAAQEEVLNTVVYTVPSSKALYYHATPDCNGQNNSRVMTVREATAAGLGPCPDCDPPVYEPLMSLVNVTPVPSEEPVG